MNFLRNLLTKLCAVAHSQDPILAQIQESLELNRQLLATINDTRELTIRILEQNTLLIQQYGKVIDLMYDMVVPPPAQGGTVQDFGISDDKLREFKFVNADGTPYEWPDQDNIEPIEPEGGL